MPERRSTQPEYTPENPPTRDQLKRLIVKSMIQTANYQNVFRSSTQVPFGSGFGMSTLAALHEAFPNVLDTSYIQINEQLTNLGGITHQTIDPTTGTPTTVQLLEWEGPQPFTPTIDKWNTAGLPGTSIHLDRGMLFQMLQSTDKSEL